MPKPQTSKYTTSRGVEYRILIHRIDGEVSEVYAYLGDYEIEFAYDLDEMIDKLEEQGTSGAAALI